MFKLKSPYRRVTPTSITETHFKMRLDLDTLASCLQKPPEILWFGVCKGNTGLLKKYVKPYAFSRDLFAKTRAFYGSPFFYGYSTYFLCTFYVFLGDTQIHEKTFQKTSKPVLQTSKCITLPLSYHILPPTSLPMAENRWYQYPKTKYLPWGQTVFSPNKREALEISIVAAASSKTAMNLAIAIQPPPHTSKRRTFWECWNLLD